MAIRSPEGGAGYWLWRDESTCGVTGAFGRCASSAVVRRARLAHRSQARQRPVRCLREAPGSSAPLEFKSSVAVHRHWRSARRDAGQHVMRLQNESHSKFGCNWRSITAGKKTVSAETRRRIHNLIWDLRTIPRNMFRAPKLRSSRPFAQLPAPCFVCHGARNCQQTRRRQLQIEDHVSLDDWLLRHCCAFRFFLLFTRFLGNAL